MKTKFRFTLLLAICASFLLVPAAQATPIIWYLSNVTFTGGGMASGSFTYDASTNTYSAINISTTGGSLPATTYTADSIGLASGLALTEGLNRNWLLAFSSPLTNGGGTIALNSVLSVEASLKSIWSQDGIWLCHNGGGGADHRHAGAAGSFTTFDRRIAAVSGSQTVWSAGRKARQLIDSAL